MTTPCWLWVGAGCLLSALAGFSAVRLGARTLGTGGWVVERPAPADPEPHVPHARPEPEVSAVAAPAVLALPEPVTTLAAPRAVRAKPAPGPAPAPTSARPDSDKLAFWARQVKAGERKMSIATDGCRVTWNRTCKHGHPSWLVHLGYLKRHQLPRHNPR